MENLIKEAINNHQIGKLDEAIKLYSKILISDSKNLDILFLIGTAMIQINDNEGAIVKLKEYININKNNYHVYSNLGIAYSNINKNNEAITSFKKSISLNPKFHHSYNNLGNIFLKTNKFDEALEYFNQAIDIKFDEDVMFNRAVTYYKKEQAKEALSDLDIILKKNSFHIKSINFRIDILNSINQQSAALSFLKQYDLNFLKTNQQILNKYIDIKIKLHQFNDINQFLSILKKNEDKNFLTANIHFKKGDFIKAEEYYLQCKNYLNNANILNNLGLLYAYYGDYHQSFEYFKKALSIDPDNKNARLNLGLNYLKHGNFIAGFDNYYYREKLKPIELTRNISELKSFDDISNKKILVFNEQGLGDQILFLNILNNFNYSNFNFLIDKRIISLYQYNFPQIIFVTDEKINYKPFTNYIFLGDLLKYFIKSTKDIKVYRKFLSLPKNLNNNIYIKKNTLLKCGLSWKSPKSNLEVRDHKSLDLFDLYTTLKNFNFEFHNLQYGDIDKDIQNIKQHFKISIKIPPFDLFNDILDLLYLIDSLDLVITTSNVTAHLAGILGKKTFLLIPKTNFNLWYWPTDGQSLWYENTHIIFYEKNNMGELNIKLNDALTCYIKSIN